MWWGGLSAPEAIWEASPEEGKQKTNKKPAPCHRRQGSARVVRTGQRHEWRVKLMGVRCGLSKHSFLRLGRRRSRPQKMRQIVAHQRGGAVKTAPPPAGLPLSAPGSDTSARYGIEVSLQLLPDRSSQSPQFCDKMRRQNGIGLHRRTGPSVWPRSALLRSSPRSRTVTPSGPYSTTKTACPSPVSQAPAPTCCPAVEFLEAVLLNVEVSR